jgi:serine/threonine-protein kinase
MASALALVHGARLLHRDVKPSNIGFTREGAPKLLDFGLVRMLSAARERSAGGGSTDTTLSGFVLSGSSSLTGSGNVVGTLPYLSPEAVGLDAPDPGFDLWSLAVTLYEALTGLQPFQDVDAAEVVRRIRAARVPDPRELAPDCPPALARFLLEALAPNPSRRPASAEAFRDSLAASLG